MLAKLVADVANHTDRLSEELLLQAKHMLSVFRQYHNQDQLVHIVNPTCEQDVLTDRWPESLTDQALFISDLKYLLSEVKQLVEGRDLEVMQKIMVNLFGEVPALEAVKAFNDRGGKEISEGRSRYDPEMGKLVIPALVTSVKESSETWATPRHTFYGTERWRR